MPLTGNSGFIAPGVHVSAPYGVEEGSVFVVWNIRRKEDGIIYEYPGWRRMTLKQAQKENRTIIKCCHCDNPAITIDHHYPYYTDYNLCENHQGKDNKQ